MSRWQDISTGIPKNIFSIYTVNNLFKASAGRWQRRFHSVAMSTVTLRADARPIKRTTRTWSGHRPHTQSKIMSVRFETNSCAGGLVQPALARLRCARSQRMRRPLQERTQQFSRSGNRNGTCMLLLFPWSCEKSERSVFEACRIGLSDTSAEQLYETSLTEQLYCNMIPPPLCH